jgi:hypothetical protein
VRTGNVLNSVVSAFCCSGVARRQLRATAICVIRLKSKDPGFDQILLFRPTRSVQAENLFLRRQLALFKERGIQPRRRNPKFGCVRIAQQISHAFGLEIDKDVVRRILAKHYRPEPGADGPSWLSFIAQVKGSLWSVDLLRCESIWLRSHWVIVVMDVFTRWLVGFGVERAYIDGVSVCRMFNYAIAGQPLPKHVST